MRIISDIRQAKATILTRKTPGQAKMAPAQSELMLQVFGEPLTPEQVDELEVPRSEIDAASSKIPADLLKALTLAADRVRDFHRRQVPQDWFDSPHGMVGPVFPPL